MRDKVPANMEKGRLTTGEMGSDASYGFNGVFVVRAEGIPVQIICSTGGGWEHVSVRPMRKQRTLTWEEMCYVKWLCWREDEWVVQFHPAKSDYVNNDPCVLHMWKSLEVEFPVPDKSYV